MASSQDILVIYRPVLPTEGQREILNTFAFGTGKDEGSGLSSPSLKRGVDGGKVLRIQRLMNNP